MTMPAQHFHVRGAHAQGPTYRVVAPLVLAKDAKGLIHHVYQNGTIEWLSDEQAQMFLELGLVEKINGNVSPGVTPTASNPPKGEQ